MSDPASDDVLGKLDALLKRHQPASDADFPVLTEVVEPPAVDLDAIPMLTEEITPGMEMAAGEIHAPEPAAPTLPMEPELPEFIPVPEPLIAEAKAEEAAPSVLEFDVPPEARYVSLDSLAPAEPPAIAAQPVPAAPVETIAPISSAAAVAPEALSEGTVRHIADIIKSDVAKILDEHLQQALAQQLQSSLHVALDRALSSMLDQFIATIEEVVRASIADELQKQLAPFKRPAPPKS